MGYYTNYKLNASRELSEAPADPPPPECCGAVVSTPYCPQCGKKRAVVLPRPAGWEEKIREIEGDNSYAYYFDDSIKWYDHDKTMRELSAQYPDVLFTLTGEGEEPGDLWVKYYKGGKCHEAETRIIFEEFDKEKLT